MLQRVITAAPVLDPAATPAQVRHIRRRGWAVVIGAGLALGLAAVLPIPATGLLALSTIGLWRRLLTRHPGTHDASPG